MLYPVSDRTKRIIEAYYSRLRKSPRPTSVWNTDRWDVLTNEPNFLRLINSSGRLKTVNVGGLAVGVGIGGVIETYAQYAKARALCYLDINCAITHVVVPAEGILLMEADRREVFCSRLLSHRDPFGKKPSLLPYDEGLLEDTAEMIYGTIEIFLEESEKNVAKEAVYKYLREFAKINDPMLTNCLTWNLLMFKAAERGNRFWLATETGWKYLKKLWENGLVYGLNADLASAESPNQDFCAFFGKIGVPMSLFYSSNIIGWLLGAGRRDKVNFSDKLKVLAANIIKIPSADGAVWASSRLADGINGSVVPLDVVDELLKLCSGKDFAHLLQIYLSGVGSYFFQPEIRTYWDPLPIAHLQNIQPRQNLYDYPSEESAFREVYDYYTQRDPTSSQDYLFYRLDDPRLISLRAQVFDRLRALVR